MEWFESFQRNLLHSSDVDSLDQHETDEDQNNKKVPHEDQLDLKYEEYQRQRETQHSPFTLLTKIELSMKRSSPLFRSSRSRLAFDDSTSDDGSQHRTYDEKENDDMSLNSRFLSLKSNAEEAFTDDEIESNLNLAKPRNTVVVSPLSDCSSNEEHGPRSLHSESLFDSLLHEYRDGLKVRIASSE